MDEPKAGALYSEAVPPRKQEFRWSNGKAPKSFDPALAATPPETDIVRCVYEGLTDIDPKTLREVPGVAEKWTASNDNRIWTFQLRKSAKWSNGTPVTANDFVRSWKRLGEMGESVAHRELLTNIIGMDLKRATTPAPNASPEPSKESAPEQAPAGHLAFPRPSKDKPSQTSKVPSPTPEKNDGRDEKPTNRGEKKFGVEATGEFILQVSLISPDKDFPRLVAHPIFRPVLGDGNYFSANGVDPSIITNGPFRITTVGTDGIVAVRSDQYWESAKVKLESIRFVPAESAEKALASYRAGDLDAVTNADLEPLALKLLSPYADFRQATHNALNFYEFNLKRAPFSDRRVREALAIGFERERLTEGEMKGATEPAFHFLPYDPDVNDKLSQDADRARKLLESAGFTNGENFPVIRLIINRNDTQLRIARSVARMWKQNLNLNAEIVVKESGEMESVRSAGDFDIIRRGVVFPTVDRSASFGVIFPAERKADTKLSRNEVEPKPDPPSKHSETTAAGPNAADDPAGTVLETPDPDDVNIAYDAAIYDFRLIPLYFPVSYGLVKPYVQGFEINGLDSPSLKDVRIDSDWQPEPLPDSQ